MSESTKEGTNPNGEEVNVELTKVQDTLNAAIAERDTLKTQLRDLNSASKGAKALQTQYEELQTKHSTLQSEFDGYKGTVKQTAIDSHVQNALDASGAHNASRVKGMLDMSKVKIADNGTVDKESLATQINALKETDSYLFKKEENLGNAAPGLTPGTPSTLPSVKPVVGDKSGDAFKLALDAAKKAKDPYKAIEEVITKYGKQ